MELLRAARVLRSQRWMILILCVTGTLAGYLFTYTLAVTYEASALVMVKPERLLQFARPADTKLLSFPVGHSMAVETPGKTFIEVMKGQFMLEQIVERLGLANRQESIGLFSTLKSALRSAKLFLKYGEVVEDDPFERALEEVEENLTMETTTDTYVFTITYGAEDPQVASAVVNTAAQLFVEWMNQAHSRDARQFRELLKGKVDEVRETLKNATLALEAFKTTHTTFSLPEEYSDRLEIISKLELELEKNDVKLAGMLKEFGPSTPAVRAAQAERERLLELLAKRRAELESYARLEEQQTYLKLDVDAAEGAYDFIRKEYHQVELQETTDSAQIQVVSAAAPPPLPEKPKRLHYAGVSFLASLILGIGLALLLDFLDTSVRSMEDVKRVLGLPVLATVPPILPRRHPAREAERRILDTLRRGAFRQAPRGLALRDP